MTMAKREKPRWGPGVARLRYGWHPWRVGANEKPPAAPPPPAQPAVTEVKSKTGTALIVLLGLGVVTVGVLELTGVTHIFGPAPKPSPAPTPPTGVPAGSAAAPPAGAAPAGAAPAGTAAAPATQTPAPTP